MSLVPVELSAMVEDREGLTFAELGKRLQRQVVAIERDATGNELGKAVNFALVNLSRLLDFRKMLLYSLHVICTKVQGRKTMTINYSKGDEVVEFEDLQEVRVRFLVRDAAAAAQAQARVVAAAVDGP